MNKRTVLVFVSIALVFLFKTAKTSYAAVTYHVSPTGSDTNQGSLAEPFGTFSKAVSVLTPGDQLKILGGTYNEPLVVDISGNSVNPIFISSLEGQKVVIDLQNNNEDFIDISGSYILVENIEGINSTGYCVNLTGQYITVQNLIVHECQDHGIYTDGQHITIANNTVFRTNLMNQSRSISGGWGSAIKVRVGGDDVKIINNTVYNNYGEGIAVTRGTNSIITGNTTYDNYSVNIYVDNSYDVLVDGNLSYCTNNSDYYINDHPADAYAIGEEYYSGWGAQLANLTFKNNLAFGCYKAIVYYGADISGGGLDNVKIINNTFWESQSTAISIPYEPSKTRNTIISNNIVQQSDQIFAWIEDRSDISMSNNFWVGGVPDDWRNAIGPDDLFSDPGLVTTPTISDSNSFKLGSNSPAIDAGMNTNISYDYFGGDRPIGTAIDIGAHEYGIMTSPFPSSILGDANNDGLVNRIDYIVWFNHYQQTVSSGSVEGDFNNNSVVDGIDYVVWLNNYGS